MKRVLAEVPWLGHARSWTSRAQREGEADDAYHFVTQEVFEGMIKQGRFLEYVQPFKDDPVRPRPDYYGRTAESFAGANCRATVPADLVTHRTVLLQ
jgi:guanylate kinase